ncbi:MAG: hypothetical protein PHR06_11175 [Candidatus Cloacimonetes bacterium]|nr:hypothetical protein [Candidatus Cloacimonadota bacterium]
MNNEKKVNVVDFSELKPGGKKYSFSLVLRFVTILFSLFAFVMSIYMIFFRINANTSMFNKIVPFIILFLAVTSLMKNLFSVNSVIIKQDSIRFCYLGMKSRTILWAEFRGMSYQDSKPRAIVIEFFRDNKIQKFIFPIGFPHMLEIVNSIAVKCPDINYDAFLKNVVILPEKK